VSIPEPGDRHWSIFEKACVAGQARGPRVMDAHLAALTIEHGATLATADRGFARFPGLRFMNPLTLEQGQ
jgi:predicted nucleic acid-binding protein